MLGVENENDRAPLGSGVLGGNGGVWTFSGSSSSVLDDIHFSSLDPMPRGADSESMRKLSAKWVDINLEIVHI